MTRNSGMFTLLRTGPLDHHLPNVRHHPWWLLAFPSRHSSPSRAPNLSLLFTRDSKLVSWPLISPPSSTSCIPWQDKFSFNGICSTFLVHLKIVSVFPLPTGERLSPEHQSSASFHGTNSTAVVVPSLALCLWPRSCLPVTVSGIPSSVHRGYSAVANIRSRACPTPCKARSDWLLQPSVIFLPLLNFRTFFWLCNSHLLSDDLMIVHVDLFTINFHSITHASQNNIYWYLLIAKSG